MHTAAKSCITSCKLKTSDETSSNHRENMKQLIGRPVADQDANDRHYDFTPVNR